MNHPNSVKALERTWKSPWENRCQEIVLIGQGLNREILKNLLDEALLTDEEFARGPSSWATLPDPFPNWS